MSAVYLTVTLQRGCRQLRAVAAVFSSGQFETVASGFKLLFRKLWTSCEGQYELDSSCASVVVWSWCGIQNRRKSGGNVGLYDSLVAGI